MAVTNIYPNRKDAEEARQHFDKHTKLPFCPLIRDYCRTDCKSWQKSTVSNVGLPGDNLFGVSKGFCKNPMFKDD